jgi:hypothetical protein
MKEQSVEKDVVETKKMKWELPELVKLGNSGIGQVPT